MFECENAEGPSAETTLWGQALEGSGSGVETAYPVKVRLQEKTPNKEEARLTVHYETPDWSRWMLRNINHGVVFSSPIQSSETPLRDLDDNLITGQAEEWYSSNSSTFVGNAVWRQKTGENLKIRPKESIIVQAYVNDEATYITPFDSLRNQVNAGSMPNVRGSEAGHLLFMGMDVVPILADGALWRVGWRFMQHHTPWNEQCITELYHWAQVWHWVGLVKFAKQVWLRLTSEAPRTHRLFEEGDFGIVESICADTAALFTQAPAWEPGISGSIG